MSKEYNPKRDENGSYKDVNVIDKGTRSNDKYRCSCLGRNRYFNTYSKMKLHFETSIHKDYLKELEYKYVCQQLEDAKEQLEDAKEQLDNLNEEHARTRSEKQRERDKRHELRKEVSELGKQLDTLEKQCDTLKVQRDTLEKQHSISLHYDILIQKENDMVIEHSGNIKTLQAEKERALSEYKHKMCIKCEEDE